MAALSLPNVSFQAIVIGLVGLVFVWQLLQGMTMGVRRRKMIRDHGCKDAYHYKHKGIAGKLLGVDVIRELMVTGKEGRLNQATRLRNYSNGINTLRIKMLRIKFIATIEPENVKTILSTKFADYSLGQRRMQAFIPVLGHGIFDTDGAAWERSRALIRPNFTRQQVADLDTFEHHIDHLIDAIPRDGSTVDLQDLFFRLTMDSATEFLFGQSTNTLAPGVETESANQFVQAFVYCTEAMANEFRSAGLTRWIPDAKWRKSVKVIHQFADDLVQAAIRRQQDVNAGNKDKSEEKERYVFLHELLKQTQDPYTLRSELLNVLLAGRDTTASLLSNTWHVLARRPDVWAKLRAEVDELQGERPDYARIKEMKYLRYVLNESLRLMPVVPGNNRTAIRDTILPLGGGPDGKSPVFISAGTIVAYSVWSMHRRTDFYGADSMEFRPERWERLRPGWEYLPFNGGPRICIGQQFALLEASYTTVRLMQRFAHIEPRDDRPWREWLTMTLASGVGCLVSLS